MKQVFGAFIAALVGVAVLCPSSGAADAKPLADKDFVAQAFVCNAAVGQYSQLAEKQANSQRVKEFARDVINDHNQCNKKLAELSLKYKVVAVTGIEKDKKEIYDRLSKLKGDDFDREYMAEMVKAHEAGIKVLERQSKTETADLRQFAVDGLATMRKHLDKARDVAKSLPAK